MGILKGLACAAGFLGGVTAGVLGYRKWIYEPQCEMHYKERYRREAEKEAA